jgi:mannose-6-phosphate isomerase-like protein (cupin superfamily)
VAAELAGGCRIFLAREGQPAPHGELKIWRHVGREHGAQAISFSVLELAPGARSAWRSRRGDEVLFVLEGEADIHLDGAASRVRPDTGVFARPGAHVTLVNPGPGPLTLFSSRCPDPGPDILFEEATFGPQGTAPASPSPIARLVDQPVERAGDGRWFAVLVDAKAGSEQVTQFVGFIPQGRAPDHFHEYEEVICILEGRGRFWSGGSFAEIAPGSCVFLPRRQPHCVENTGTEPLKLYGVFYPVGSPSVRYHPGGVSPLPPGEG